MTEITTPEPMPTPLLDRHEALGAKIVEFAGWLMPISYAGILEEHRAVRSAAGLFDLSHMGELVVEGPEAGVALAAALVTDPPSLAVGRAHYSMICAPDGGILDDLIVYRLAPERFMVVANASNSRTVSDALAERLDGFGAVLDDRSLATGLVAIQGPRSLEILQPLAGVDLASIRYYGIAEGVVAGIPAQVARTGYTGEDGFELFLDVERAGEAWDAVLEAGRPLGLVPVGLGARDTLRLEAGMPLYGNELDRATTPYEAGLDRVVKLAKAGDFTGRAALETRRHRGHPAPPCRARPAGPRDRPPRLPGPRCRRGHGRRHLGDDVAHARRGDRHGVRRTGACPTRYDARCRDPRCTRRGRGGATPVLQAARLTSGERPVPRRKIEVRTAPTPETPVRRHHGGTARMVPGDLRYTKEHEWVRVDGDEAVVGITQFAADQLGDIVFVELPAAGKALERHATFGVVESVKAVSDLFAPVAGEVTGANDALAGSPELVNSDPYGEGWMLRISLADPAQVEELLDAAAYEQLVTEA